MRVLIMGGGLGGLCLAQGLVKAGVEVAVFERDRTRSDRLDRYRLHVSPAGSRALRACLPDSAWEAFLLGVGDAEGGFGFLTEQLRTLVVVDDDVMYPPSADAAERAYPVDRLFLRETLLRGLDGIVQFGRQLERYAQLPDGSVTAHFADGSSTTGDVLVGADGPAGRAPPVPARDRSRAHRRIRHRVDSAPARFRRAHGSRTAAHRPEHDHGACPVLPLHLGLPPART